MRRGPPRRRSSREIERRVGDRDRGPGEGLRRDPRRRRHRPRGAAPARCTASSARTAPARPPPSACWPPCSGPTPARPGCFGHDVVREADAVRGCVSLTGQFASVDEELTGRENLVLLGRLLGFSPPAGRASGPASCSTPSGCRRRRPAGAGLLGRHASPPRHRRQHRRHARAAVPRRADHRPRPAEPQPGVGDRPGAGRRGHHGAAHDPVPRRGRPARRPHRHHRPRQGHRRGHLRRAQGVGRLGRPARAPARPRPAARGRAGAAPRARRAGPPRGRPGGALGAGRRRRAGRRRPGRSWPAPASPSPSSPSASPASTRCSSPSPATRPKTTTEESAA